MTLSMASRSFCGAFAKPYPGKSTRYQESFIRKWLTVLVFPGLEEIRASLELEQRQFIRDDLPTLLRPMNANSGSLTAGFPDTVALLQTNFAEVIFIPGEEAICCCKFIKNLLNLLQKTLSCL